MAETLETLANRIDRLETKIQQMSKQFSQFTEEQPEQEKPDKPKTGVELIRERAIDKRQFSKGVRELLKQMGIPEKPTIPIEELQERVAYNSRPEDNEASREIIAEREK